MLCSSRNVELRKGFFDAFRFSTKLKGPEESFVESVATGGEVVAGGAGGTGAETGSGVAENGTGARVESVEPASELVARVTGAPEDSVPTAGAEGPASVGGVRAAADAASGAFSAMSKRGAGVAAEATPANAAIAHPAPSAAIALIQSKRCLIRSRRLSDPDETAIEGDSGPHSMSTKHDF